MSAANKRVSRELLGAAVHALEGSEPQTPPVGRKRHRPDGYFEKLQSAGGGRLTAGHATRRHLS